MFEEGISEQWLRRAAWVIYIFFGAFALLGLGYVWYAAAGGEVFKAMIGAAGAMGSIGLGIGMHCVMQLASVVATVNRALEELGRRADAMETLLQESGLLVNLAGVGSGDPSSLVASDAACAFPRLVADGTNNIADEIPSGDIEVPAPVTGTLDQAEVAVSAAPAQPLTGHQLRCAFRDSVYSGDFSGALDVGSAIVADDPDSEMAVQFNLLRPALERRARQGSQPVHAKVS